MRRLLAATAAVALATTLAACGGGGGSSDDQLVRQRLRRDAQHQGGRHPHRRRRPIYLGVEQGFFKDRKMDVEIVQTTGGAAAVPGVVSGDFQFAFANITSLLLAQSTGLPLKVVASGNASTGDENADFAGIVVPPGSPITAPRSSRATRWPSTTSRTSVR